MAWHIKSRQDQTPPPCIKAEQGIPLQGMDSKKLTHVPWMCGWYAKWIKKSELKKEECGGYT